MIEKELKPHIKKVSIRLTLDYNYLEKIQFLMGRLKSSTYQDVIKILINNSYIENKMNLIRYGDGSQLLKPKSMGKDGLITKIKEMNAVQLQEYLLKVGYFEPDHDEDQWSDTIIQDRIEEIDGNMVYLQKRYSKSRQKVDYRREVFSNIDEIISNVIKERKLKPIIEE